MSENLLTQAMKAIMAKTLYAAKKSQEVLSKVQIPISHKPESIKTLFDSNIKLGDLILPNRIVMAPMTRCRATNNLPNNLMAEYYQQRSSAGLIITEGTSPSPNGLGQARIPGIFSEEQIRGWQKVTEAVHKNNGKIIIQLMHTGRMSHPLNMPDGSQILAPSALKARGQIWTDAEQMQDFPIPKEMTKNDLQLTKLEFVTASENAIEAGFDGVEIHAVNGYLFEQFLSPSSNMRTDKYGGSLENRCRYILEIVADVAASIGKQKTGVRLSPFGVTSNLPNFPELDETFEYLAQELNVIDVAYIHLVDHSKMGNTAVPEHIKRQIRQCFKNTLILSGGYHKETADEDLMNGLGDLVAFGRPFISNPDFVERLKNNWSLSHKLKMELFYTDGAKGYTDYPNHRA